MSLLNFAINHWDDISAAVVVVGGYLWKKAHHQKTESLWDTAEKLGLQLLPKLLADPNLHDDAYVRAKINAGIWTGLERLGVKHSKTLDKLVDEVSEHVKAELAGKLMDQLLGKYIQVSTQTVGELKAAT